jgi:Peptidase A4 family
VAANWIVPPVTCNGTATKSSYAVGLDGDGTATTEQIGTEGDCDGDFGVYSGWFQVAPNAPVFFTNPVKPGDAMTASVTALGGGSFMLSLFDMTQNWTQITEQTSTAATLGSAEIVAQDPVQNGQAQPLSNFGIVDFLGAAINNAPINAPINEVTLVSAAGNTLAVPSTITGGVGNFAVGWDASA